MRIPLLLAVVCAAVVAPLSEARAQLSSAEPPVLNLPFQPVADVADIDGSEPRGWEDRVLSAVGAAALGAGMGFFLSQVDHSDWDEVPGHREASRGLWSALGGGVGLAVGLKFPVSIMGGPADRTARRETPGRSVIPPEVIQDVSADNAYQIVRLLRPEWLNKRPPRYLGQIESEGLPVYLDDFRYGDLESMRGIHADVIESIRFVPAAVAAARWGKDHHRGVIQIITVG